MLWYTRFATIRKNVGMKGLIDQNTCFTYSTQISVYQNMVLTVAGVVGAAASVLVMGTTGADDVTAMSSSSPNGSYGRWSFSLASSTVIHTIHTFINTHTKMNCPIGHWHCQL